MAVEDLMLKLSRGIEANLAAAASELFHHSRQEDLEMKYD
jgi:hypothetical protein